MPVRDLYNVETEWWTSQSILKCFIVINQNISYLIWHKSWQLFNKDNGILLSYN